MRRGIPGGSSKGAELVSGCVGFGSPAAVAVVDGVAAEIALWDGLIPVERVGGVPEGCCCCCCWNYAVADSGGNA